MAQAQVVPADRNQRAAMEAVGAELERRANATASSIASRYALWSTFTNIAASYDVDPAELVGANTAALNQAADKSAKQWARVLVNLQQNTAELVARVEGSQLVVGVLPRGAIKGPLNGFPILWVVVVSGAAVLAWLSLDAVADGERAEADAVAAHEANQAARIELLKQAQARGAMAVQLITDAMQKADAAASSAAHNPQATFDKLAGALVSAGGSSVSVGPSSSRSSGSSGSSMATKAGAALFVLFLLWLWSNRKKVKQGVHAWL